MGAEDANDAAHAIESSVEGRITQLKETRSLYEIQRAAALSNALDGMKDALVAAQNALDGVVFKDTEHRNRAEAKLRGEIGEALTALHDTMRASESDAAMLLDTTRDELTELGVAAKEGPPKPSSWNPGGIFGSEARFGEWMKKLDRNPRELLQALAGIAKNAADEGHAEAASPGPKQKAAREVSRGDQVVAYFSGRVTGDRMKKYDDPETSTDTAPE